jgi:hypothetical protein
MIFEITHSGLANSFTVTADNPKLVHVIAPEPLTVTISLQRDGIDGRDGIDAVPAIIDGGFIY